VLEECGSHTLKLLGRTNSGGAEFTEHEGAYVSPDSAPPRMGRLIGLKALDLLERDHHLRIALDRMPLNNRDVSCTAVDCLVADGDPINVNN
jgi:hypothetical protein